MSVWRDPPAICPCITCLPMRCCMYLANWVQAIVTLPHPRDAFEAGWTHCRDGAMAAESLQRWLNRSFGYCGTGMCCRDCTDGEATAGCCKCGTPP